MEPPAPGTRSGNLVFTSAGGRSNLRAWLNCRRDFDLWVVYYGDEPSPFHNSRKGSKFQNLHYCYQHARALRSRDGDG